jgi:VanZ family protein
MGMIFYLSSQPPEVSYGQSKFAIKIISKVNNFFDISDSALYGKVAGFIQAKWFLGFYKSTNFVVRKSAHFGIYLLFAIFASSFAYIYSRKILMGVLLGISLPITVAVLDEFNQGFVGRLSSLEDVIIDGTGALTGSILFLAVVLIIRVINELGLSIGFRPFRKKRRHF